jgi:hypothetical protein
MYTFFKYSYSQCTDSRECCSKNCLIDINRCSEDGYNVLGLSSGTTNLDNRFAEEVSTNNNNNVNSVSQQGAQENLTCGRVNEGVSFLFLMNIYSV